MLTSQRYDNCYNEGIIPEKRYPVMRDALNKTGKQIFFSMCEWGMDNPATWAGEVRIRERRIKERRVSIESRAMERGEQEKIASGRG